jgi:predicted acylesterase/phospholipase RssA
MVAPDQAAGAILLKLDNTVNARRAVRCAAVGLLPLLAGCAITKPPGPHCAQFANAVVDDPNQPSKSVILPPGGDGGRLQALAATSPAQSRLSAYPRAIQDLAAAKAQAIAAAGAKPGQTAGESRQAMDAERRRTLEVNLLVLSGGGQWGAYGSGFLNGLYGAQQETAHISPKVSGLGPVQEIPLAHYNVITGISTGSLMIPDLWAAVIEARRNDDSGVRTYLGDLQNMYSYDDSQLIKTENAVIYVLFSNGLLDPKGGLEEKLNALLGRTLPVLQQDGATVPDAGDGGSPEFRHTTVDVGAVNLTDGKFYSFHLPDIVAADAGLRSQCLPEILLGSAAIPLGFPPRYMDGDAYMDGGIRYLAFVERFFTGARSLARDEGLDIRINVRLIVNGNQSVNDPGDEAGVALACDKARAPGDGAHCPTVSQTLLGSFTGLSTGKGIILRVTQDVMLHQLKMDSVYRLYHGWRDTGLPGSFAYTYVSNQELLTPPPGTGLSKSCLNSGGHFNADFEACLFAIGRYKGARQGWDFGCASKGAAAFTDVVAYMRECEVEPPRPPTVQGSTPR